MATAVKKEKSIELTCECGNIHTITQNEAGTLEVTSVFKKAKKQEPEPEKRMEENAAQKKDGSIFDLFK